MRRRFGAWKAYSQVCICYKGLDEMLTLLDISITV